jgi:hypothetical protein
MKFKKREKRFIFFLIMFCVAFSSYILIEKLVKNQKQIREDISDSIWTIKKNEDVLKMKDLYAKEKTSAQAILQGVVDFLLQDADPAIAAANLQKTLDKFASESNMSIQSKKARNPADIGIFKEIPVEINLKSTTKQLEEFLYKVEYKIPKLLVIRQIEIRIDNYRDPREIFTKIVVAGYILNKKK